MFNLFNTRETFKLFINQWINQSVSQTENRQKCSSDSLCLTFNWTLSHREKSVHQQTQNSAESCAPLKCDQQSRRSALYCTIFRFSYFYNITVKLFPISAVIPWCSFPLPRYYRYVCPHYHHYRGKIFWAVPTTAGLPWITAVLPSYPLPCSSLFHGWIKYLPCSTLSDYYYKGN